MKTIITTLVTIIICVTGKNSYALVLGGTNFSFTGYPKHTCLKPSKPYQFNDEYEIERYKTGVNAYVSCINEYIKNADDDIKRIQESAEDALNEANTL